VARDVLPRALRDRGTCVDVVEAYRTIVPESAVRQAEQIFGGSRKPDWVTFTSSSTVQNFVQAAGATALHGVKVASIGPVTTATAKKLGITVTVEASPYTTDGLVASIVKDVTAT
jgi:uroporphyrinogen-III synthase